MAHRNVHFLGASEGWSALVERYRKAIPRPEHRVAAAILEGLKVPLAQGVSDKEYLRFKAPGGKLERLGWAVCGYRKPGDKFRGPTDAWWSAPMADPSGFYGTLLAWAQLLDKGGYPPASDDLARWNVALANGERPALEGFLAQQYQDLLYARAAGVEASAPGVPPIPRRPPAPTLPDKPVPVPTPTLPGVGSVPAWVRLALVGAALYFLLKDR